MPQTVHSTTLEGCFISPELLIIAGLRGMVRLGSPVPIQVMGDGKIFFLLAFKATVGMEYLKQNLTQRTLDAQVPVHITLRSKGLQRLDHQIQMIKVNYC